MSDDVTTASPEKPGAQVPELVGVPAAEAHDRALDAGLLAVPENAWHTGAGRAHIARQEPEPGTAVSRGSIVRIWISTDSGVPS
ncbi:PASTA domain-containing protein [Actinomycetospora lutea]|uniref:PASTA domain-containing protein n=1 Tax=Actinomycetospora lutea TaxID=663604 RepID=UPI002365A096|nr:PASTA domain-containing protein [Actinomycetospora lutea]MDD7942561.1 PASTA domain-containing protein [Actinomycetospora lutea]